MIKKSIGVFSKGSPEKFVGRREENGLSETGISKSL